MASARQSKRRSRRLCRRYGEDVGRRSSKPETYDAYDVMTKDAALLNWISHPLFSTPQHELIVAWVKSRDDKGHAFADAKMKALTQAKTAITGAADIPLSRQTIDAALATARPYLQSKSPYWQPLVAQVQDAYVAKLESIGTAEKAEQERKEKEQEKAKQEKKGGGQAPTANASPAGPLGAKADDHKDAAGGKKDGTDPSAKTGAEAKDAHKPPPAPAPATPTPEANHTPSPEGPAGGDHKHAAGSGSAFLVERRTARAR